MARRTVHKTVKTQHAESLCYLQLTSNVIHSSTQFQHKNTSALCTPWLFRIHLGCVKKKSGQNLITSLKTSASYFSYPSTSVSRVEVSPTRLCSPQDSGRLGVQGTSVGVTVKRGGRGRGGRCLATHSVTAMLRQMQLNTSDDCIVAKKSSL